MPISLKKLIQTTNSSKLGPESKLSEMSEEFTLINPWTNSALSSDGLVPHVQVVEGEWDSVEWEKMYLSVTNEIAYNVCCWLLNPVQLLLI